MGNSNRYISTTVFHDKTPLETALKALTDIGYQNIELGSTHAYESDVRKILKNYPSNFLVHNYFPSPRSDMIFNIIASDETIRTQSIEQIKKRIIFSKEISAKLYTFHPGYLTHPLASNPTDANWDFVYDPDINEPIPYNKAFESLIDSVNHLVKIAEEYKQPIAMESAGSVGKKEYLFMQRLDEFKSLFHEIDSAFFGVNLNLGHLNLSSRVFDFDRLNFVESIKDKIFAFEVSHNNGFEDNHALLKSNEWYWEIINDTRFSDIPIIFEGRNIPLEQCASIWNPFQNKDS